ncbi:MAG: hypothetical protein WAX89_00160 [Alphaproteobacteria bacterium]
MGYTQRLNISSFMLAAMLAAGVAHADTYASGYSHGGSNDYLSGYGNSSQNDYLSGYGNSGYTRSYGTTSNNYGSRGGYVRDFTSTQWGGAVTIQRRADYAQVRAQAAANQAARNAYHNANPPCGVYGRVPARCLRGQRD